jgi:hypothetical protein
MTTALSAGCSLSNITLNLPLLGVSQIAARCGTKNTHTRATCHDLVKPADVRCGSQSEILTLSRCCRFTPGSEHPICAFIRIYMSTRPTRSSFQLELRERTATCPRRDRPRMPCGGMTEGELGGFPEARRPLRNYRQALAPWKWNDGTRTVLFSTWKHKRVRCESMHSVSPSGWNRMAHCTLNAPAPCAQKDFAVLTRHTTTLTEEMMNKVKLLGATAILVTALSASAFAQEKGVGAGGGLGGGGSAGGGAAVSGPAGGSAGGGASVSGRGSVGSSGGGMAVNGRASQGRSFEGSGGAPSARGEFRTGSSGIRDRGDRTFATDHGDFGRWHHRRGGRFGVGVYSSYAYGDCYLVRKRVLTPYGWRVRRVQVCD